MCTAITYQTQDHYFGRTLDHDCSYGESVVVTPRRYPFAFTSMGILASHYAMIGMAHVAEGYPLYYDAVNEKGLCMAGLHFADNAQYAPTTPGRENVAQFELIPWLLGQCASLDEVRERLGHLNLDQTAFHDTFPPAPLHWLIADASGAITLEFVAEGMRVYDNPVGVLTNDPTFDRQMFQLNHYMHLSPKAPENLFAPGLSLRAYSRGMGALGLPGDLSSPSRFVRAAFVRLNGVSGSDEQESVSQFFHMLGAVEQPRGSSEVAPGQYEITRYTACCNATKGIYYYTTYGNHQITAVDLYQEALDGQELAEYPLVDTQQIRWENRR